MAKDTQRGRSAVQPVDTTDAATAASAAAAAAAQGANPGSSPPTPVNKGADAKQKAATTSNASTGTASSNMSAVMAGGKTVGVTVKVGGDVVEPQEQDADDSNGHASAAKTKKTASAKKGKSPKKKPTQEKSTDPNITADEDKDLAFIWICTECREAECLTDPDSPLLVCEGPCQRPFHYPCAGLNAVPPETETWICNDCRQNRHQCAVCSEYGADDDDVFKCDRAACGLYFHENCLAMYENVEMTIVERTVETKEIDPATGRELVTGTQVICRPKFKCPAHTCWCCSGGMPPDPNAAATAADGDGADADGGGDTNGKDGTSPKGGAKGKKGGKGGKKGKKRKKAKVDNAFGEKKEQLFRCLDCPIAYHITCIPPCTRFHELALLCHEHYTNKLPDLDTESSFQAEVEAKADAMVEQMRETKRRKLERLKKQKEKKDDHYVSVGFNKFLFGMKGTAISEAKQDIHRLLDESDAGAARAAAPVAGGEEEGDAVARPVKKLRQVEFCLPCDFQQDVYAKPPMYTHVHGLKYDPVKRPKKHTPSNEVCKCKPSDKDGTVTCHDHCLNRMVMAECVGDKSKSEKNPYWNCNAGPNCGNRAIGQRKYAKCRPKREQGKGWGLMVVDGVKKGGLVQEYGGEVIDEKSKEARLGEWARDHPNDPNFYIMSLEPGWYIDARVKGNLARFINHSCGPNCYLVPTNVSGNMRVAVVALRDISPGEFLCYDYQFDTKHGDKFVCRCGAPNCRGTMKGGEKGRAGGVEVKKTKKQLLAEAKARYDRDKKFLEDLVMDQATRLNQTGLLVPGEFQQKDSSTMVASGPQEKDRDYAQGRRIFLWRNVYPGSNFSSRYWKFEDAKKKSKRGSASTSLPNIDVLSQLRGS